MPLWLADAPLVLASKSEVRRKLLEAALLPVEVKPAQIDERAVEMRAGARTPEQAAQVLARAKADAVAASLPGRLVLGADQTLSLNKRRFDKPANRAAARAQLQALSGESHTLHTAVALIRDGAVLFEHVETARLTMRELSDEFLDRYLDAAGDAAFQSVGGYQIEAAGVHLFARIDGDYFAILGLPLAPLLDFLRGNGFVAH